MHRCNLGVVLEQETILGLSGPGPKRLLAPSLIDFSGKTGIRALYQAIGIPILPYHEATKLGVFDLCYFDLLNFLSGLASSFKALVGKARGAWDTRKARDQKSKV